MAFQVTARVDYDRTRPTSRPPSPYKPQTISPSSSNLIKPKAKVNSSANVTIRKTNAVRGTSPAPLVRNSGIPPPRAPSPFKQLHSPIGATVSAPPVVKARVTARPKSSHVASSAFETRQRSLTTVPSDSALAVRTRHRRGSISSQVSHVVSPAHSEVHGRAYARGPASPTEENGHPLSNVGRGVRVKSKVTKVDSTPQSPTSTSSSPVLSTVGRGVHERMPSIPSISVAAPLLPANAPPPSALPQQHRFATTRESPIHRPHAFQPFPSNDDLAVNYGAYSVAAKVDPAAIPLPPQSPPMSAISFSSHSSASRSSVSYDTHGSDATRSTALTVHSRLTGDMRARRDNRLSRTKGSLDGPGVRSASLSSREASADSDDDVEEPDHLDGDESDDLDKMLKDEAKSNRKIADLEISNRSLLAINSSLEAAKHRQAKEIRDLKRKLRESRLILPPPTYRAVKSSLPAEEVVKEEEEDSEEVDEDEDEQELLEGKDDEPYRRVKLILDTLLESCRRALESKPSDFVEGIKSGAKVLSAEEVRSWRGDDAEADSRSITDADRDDDGHPHSVSAVDQEDQALESEDEVEDSLFREASLPPITVTPS